MLALAVKLGPKLATVALKLLKSIKPGAALVTLAAYSVVFSWKFAVAFLVLVGFHECGHVYAMWRSGVGVKGIYFVPFFGGVAVAERAALTAKQDGYIAINGPVWGTYLAVLTWLAFVLLAPNWPLLGAVAAWGALLNLFNLLPVMPLDGGRILSALAFGRRPSAELVAGSLLLGLALAYVFQLELLALMVAIGLMEFTSHLRRANMAPLFGWLSPQRPLDAAAYEHFDRMVGVVEKGARSTAAIERRWRVFEDAAAHAQQTPMSTIELIRLTGQYVLLVAVLLYVMWRARSIDGVGDPWGLLM